MASRLEKGQPGYSRGLTGGNHLDAIAGSGSRASKDTKASYLAGKHDLSNIWQHHGTWAQKTSIQWRAWMMSDTNWWWVDDTEELKKFISEQSWRKKGHSVKLPSSRYAGPGISFLKASQIWRGRENFWTFCRSAKTGSLLRKGHHFTGPGSSDLNNLFLAQKKYREPEEVSRVSGLIWKPPNISTG